MKLSSAAIAFVAFLTIAQTSFGRPLERSPVQSEASSVSLSSQPSSVHRGPFDQESGFFHFNRPQRLGRKLEQALTVSPQQVIAQMKAANKDKLPSSPLPSQPGSPVRTPAKPSRAPRLSHSSSYHSALEDSLPSTPKTPKTPRTPKTPSLREHGSIAEHRPKGGRWRKVTRKLTACLRCSKPRAMG
jgi:hypothetical protein